MSYIRTVQYNCIRLYQIDCERKQMIMEVYFELLYNTALQPTAATLSDNVPCVLALL